LSSTRKFNISISPGAADIGIFSFLFIAERARASFVPAACCVVRLLQRLYRGGKKTCATSTAITASKSRMSTNADILSDSPDACS
jgi:hypothetical protein